MPQTSTAKPCTNPVSPPVPLPSRRPAPSAAAAAAADSKPKLDAVQLEEEALGRIQAAVAERYTAAVAGQEVRAWGRGHFCCVARAAAVALPGKMGQAGRGRQSNMRSSSRPGSEEHLTYTPHRV